MLSKLDNEKKKKKNKFSVGFDIRTTIPSVVDVDTGFGSQAAVLAWGFIGLVGMHKAGFTPPPLILTPTEENSHIVEEIKKHENEIPEHKEDEVCLIIGDVQTYNKSTNESKNEQNKETVDVFISTDTIFSLEAAIEQLKIFEKFMFGARPSVVVDVVKATSENQDDINKLNVTIETEVNTFNSTLKGHVKQKQEQILIDEYLAETRFSTYENLTKYFKEYFELNPLKRDNNKTINIDKENIDTEKPLKEDKDPPDDDDDGDDEGEPSDIPNEDGGDDRKKDGWFDFKLIEMIREVIAASRFAVGVSSLFYGAAPLIYKLFRSCLPESAVIILDLINQYGIYKFIIGIIGLPFLIYTVTILFKPILGFIVNILNKAAIEGVPKMLSDLSSTGVFLCMIYNYQSFIMYCLYNYPLYSSITVFVASYGAGKYSMVDILQNLLSESKNACYYLSSFIKYVTEKSADALSKSLSKLSDGYDGYDFSDELKHFTEELSKAKMSNYQLISKGFLHHLLQNSL